MLTVFNKFTKNIFIICALFFSLHSTAQIISSSLTVNPPYGIPVSELVEQSTLQLNVGSITSNFTLGWRISNSFGTIVIGSNSSTKENLDLEVGLNIFSGSDFSTIFNFSNLSSVGINGSSVYFDTGLPAGDYVFEYFVFQGRRIVNTSRFSFTVAPSVQITTTLNPPFTNPFNELADQTNVILTANARVLRGFPRLILTGPNGISISTDPNFMERITLGANVPLIIDQVDLERLFSYENLIFQNISEEELNRYGLPPGDYDLCFEFYNSAGEKVSIDAPNGCTSFTIDRPTVVITPTIIPPYTSPFTDLALNTTISIFSNRDYQTRQLIMRVEGENGIIIETRGNFNFPLDLVGNENIILSGDDLTSLFEERNLRVTGMEESVLFSSGLPAGNYEFCFRLVDNFGSRIGRTSCVDASIENQTTVNVAFQPPYETPFGDLNNQLTVLINSSSTINDFTMQMEMSSSDGNSITSILNGSPSFDIEGNTVLDLSAQDLDYYFSSSNLTLNGFIAADLFTYGLPAGDYEICFNLFDVGGENFASGCSTFRVGRGEVNLTTNFIPPYEATLNDWPDQTMVNINTTRGISDGSIQFSLNSDNGIQIVSDFLDLPLLPNEVKSLSIDEIESLLAISQLNIQGITAQELNNQGLPAGNYEYCFQYFYGDGEPASGNPPAGCESFRIQPTRYTISTLIAPPFEAPFSELGNQVNINMTSSRNSNNHSLRLNLFSDNGEIVISSTNSATNFTFDLIANTPNEISSSVIEALLESSNLTIQGLDENQLYNEGLPAGNYTLCFQAFDENGNPITPPSEGCANFTINKTIINMIASVSPAYDVPLSQLLEQASVSINSSRDLDDLYLLMKIEDVDGNNIMTQRSDVFTSIDLQANEQSTFSISDLLNPSIPGATFSGFDRNEILSEGFPPGSYKMCFDLFNERNQLLVSESCTNFLIEENIIILTSQLVNPVSNIYSGIPEQATINIMASSPIQMSISMSLRSDNGVNIENTTDFLDNILTIQGGEPVQLFGNDLSPFFAQQNINLIGIDQNSLFNERLPEGSYELCFTAFDTNKNPLEIPSSCHTFELRAVEPPILLTPICESIIPANDITPIVFNWMPAVGVDPRTEYVLKIVEMPFRERNPNEALIASTTPSFFETEVIGTSYFYGPADPILDPGKKYAFLVYVNEPGRAFNFQNGGVSAACYFTIKEEKNDANDTLSITDLPIDIIKDLEVNKFPGYFFPSSELSGTLYYTYDLKKKAMVGLPAKVQKSDAVVSKDGNIIKFTNSDNDPIHNFYVNQDQYTAESKYPLSNVKISLIKTYLLFGEMNGKNHRGKAIKSGDIMSGQHQFNQIVTGNEEVLATTTTDGNGNFDFYFISDDSLSYESTPISWTYDQGDIFIDDMNIQGDLYPIYRIRIESPYYCSPDINIRVQPWESIDLGEIISRINAYDLTVRVMRDPSLSYDYAHSNAVELPGAIAAIKRNNTSVPYLPEIEGSLPDSELEGTKVSTGITDVNGFVKFKNLIRHNANHPLDHYIIETKTSENTGTYNYKTTETPYPIFPYHSLWECDECPLHTTHYLPTSQDFKEPKFFQYNSEFQRDSFYTEVFMKPSFPRVAGRVYSKTREILPSDLSDDVASVSDIVNSEIELTSSGFSTSNASEKILLNFDQEVANIPKWSNLLDLKPLENAELHLASKASSEEKDHIFTKTLIHLSDVNGKYNFPNLQMELEPAEKSDIPGKKYWRFDVKGPERRMIARYPGYKTEFINLGILKWGQQTIKNFELEPEGLVYGWITDEAGNPIKAEIYINDLTQIETVSGDNYQSALNLSGNQKEIFILKAPSGVNQVLKIIPVDPGYSPATYKVDILANQDITDPQNLGPFIVRKLKHRMKFRVMAKLDENAAITKTPIKNALVKVTNVLADVPQTNENYASSSSSPLTSQQINEASPISSDSKDNAQLLNNNNLLQNQTVLGANNYYGYTDEDGYVELKFENNAENFIIKVLPPLDIDAASSEIDVKSYSTDTSVFHGEILLNPAYTIEGYVTYGIDSLALNDARVYVELGSELIQTFTDNTGYYKLKGIPADQKSWSVKAENMDQSMVLVGKDQIVNMPTNANIDFNLNPFTEFDLSSIWGLPITVERIERIDEKYIIDGAFIHLNNNPNFSLKDNSTRLPFKGLMLKSEIVNGQTVGVPQQSEIEIEKLSIETINYTSFLAEARGGNGQKLIIKNTNQLGYLSAEVLIQSTSFKFDNNYVAFDEVQHVADLFSEAKAMVNPTIVKSITKGEKTPVTVTSDGFVFIDIFDSNAAFNYKESSAGNLLCTVFSADSLAIRPYFIANDKNDVYAYKIQDFNAEADLTSFAYRDSIFLNTSIRTNTIAQMVPSQLEIDIGMLTLTKDGFDPIGSEQEFSFNIEEWEFTIKDWTLDQHVSGLQIHRGTLNTNLFVTQMKDLKIMPDGFDKGKFDLNAFTFGGIIPVDLRTEFVDFLFVPQSTPDNKDHYMLAIAGSEGNAAAAISALPGMNTNDELLFESIYLYSNGYRELNFMGDSTFTFYQVLDFSPRQFTMFEGGFEIEGSGDLNIPRLNAASTGFRYTLDNGQLVSKFLGIDIDFEGLGHVKFVSSDVPNTQWLTEGNYDAMGTISDKEGIILSGRIHKDLDSIYVIVEPLGQELLISSDGSNKFVDVTGDMHVVNNDWDYFVFEGDMEGFTGVEEGEDIRKTFIVKGSIEASGEAVGVKNIDVGFGEISIIYDIANARLTGHLAFEHSFSGLSIAGQVNFLADNGGWYFIANGEVEAPGLGIFKAGLAIGDYNEMNYELESKLLQDSYIKNLPAGFENSFSGFLFVGNKNIPQLSIPKVDIDIGIARLSVEGGVGIDARLWMSFADGGATFGIGVMAYATAKMVLSAVTCTDILGYLSVELGVEGSYNTVTKEFQLQGCGSVTLMGAVSQCTPIPWELSCGDPCLSFCESLSFRLIMEVSSKDGFDASMEMGNCSGNLPTLDQELGDTFNCN